MAAPRIVGRFTAARRQPALTSSGDGRRVVDDVTAPIITIRDPRTLEIRQFLPLPRARDEQYLYTFDAYFYFPRSFGISAESWSQADFYRDADIFMRLHAPGMELGELADLDNAQNPGAVLRRQLPLLLSDDAPRASSLAKLAQLYSAELADAAVGAVEKLRGAVTAAAARGETAGLEGIVQRTCADLLAALGSVRRLRAKIAAFRALEPPELPQALAFAEEYASAVIDQELSELPLLIEQLPGLRDGQATAARLRVLVSRTLAQINHRRLEQGFATPWGDATEYFSYRIGLLKAELERALHIDTRQRASDPFIRNSAAMVAAGLAATWAVLAQVQFGGSDYTRDHQVLFISIAVLAYVLKDRIKEWTRQVLSNRILHWDHDREIVGDAMGRVGFGAFSGRARERVRYVTEAQVPAEISDLRVAHRTVRGVATESEQILHYRRHLQFAAGPTPVPVGFGAQGLLRLSLDEIIRRLDDPVELVRFYDYKTGRFSGAEVPKVHHLNLVLMSTDQHAHVRTLLRVRVVVNQRGVVRLDPVTVKHRPLW